MDAPKQKKGNWYITHPISHFFDSNTDCIFPLPALKRTFNGPRPNVHRYVKYFPENWKVSTCLQFPPRRPPMGGQIKRRIPMLIFPVGIWLAHPFKKRNSTNISMPVTTVLRKCSICHFSIVFLAYLTIQDAPPIIICWWNAIWLRTCMAFWIMNFGGKVRYWCI